MTEELGRLSQEVARAGVTADEAMRTLGAAMKRAGTMASQLAFEVWLWRQPRWQRPLMRFARRIERWLLR